MSGKHQTYFELREALVRPGCVVCRLAARSVRRYLEALSFESVNDYTVRKELRRARGFCNLHGWQLLDEVRDPFGAGIIYRDVLNHCADLIEAGQIAALTPERPCPACEARARSAARYVDVLGEHMDEPSFAEALGRSGGLCWRHFALGVARGARGLARLAELQMAAIRGGGVGGSAMTARARIAPTPGVRAGNAAPRPAPDEVVGDAVIAAAVGLPGLTGTAIEGLPARDWGTGPLGVDQGMEGERSLARREPSLTKGRDAVGEDDECAACATARLAVHSAIARMVHAPPGPLELCAPHAWLAGERVGAEAVRARLRPGLMHFAERIAESTGDIDTAAPIVFGPFELALPAARRARGDLALRLSPGRDCAVCAAQIAAEDELIGQPPTGWLCRPHVLILRRAGVGQMNHWRSIVADLDEYIRKNDYRFRDEPRGPEQSSPLRAVATISAGRGLR